MTQEKYECCVFVARSFIHEFITEGNLNKKKHGELFELHDKIGKEMVKLSKKHKNFLEKVEERITTVLKIMEKNVDIITKSKDNKEEKQNKKEIEANKLAFGLSFIFLLIEHNMFKGSQMMYYKRVANKLFNICERESKKEAIQNANRLIHMFDEDIK